MATCRIIYNEARSIINDRRKHQVHINIPRIVIDIGILHYLFKDDGFLEIAHRWREALKSQDDRGFDVNDEKYQEGSESVSEEETMRLNTWIDLCGRKMYWDPTTYFEIRTFGKEHDPLYMDAVFQMCFRLQSAGIREKIGIAAPHYFENFQRYVQWEDHLTVEMEALDSQLQVVREALVASGDFLHVARAERFMGTDQWDADWGTEYDPLFTLEARRRGQLSGSVEESLYC